MRMTKDNKHAYTLAEIMIVMLILTIIFAAFAPLFTGRIKKTYKSKYNVWSWVDRTSYDITAASSDPSSTNEMFFGVSPNDGNEINTTFAPLARVVIRSGDVTQDAITQRQIQFRYGRTTSTGSNPNGTFAGTWLVDGSNYLLGGTYKNLKESDDLRTSNNTAIGYNALSSIKRSGGNTAIGYNALTNLTERKIDDDYHPTNNTAVGYRAGESTTTGYKNTFVGAGAGYKNTTGFKNTAVGYNAMSADTITGHSNTLIGSHAGYKISSGSNNTAVGYLALSNLTSGNYNVAIGYNALGSLTSGSNNTAIGYNACAEVTTGSNKTCIGYNSGPHQYSRTNLNSTDWDPSKDKSTADFLGGRTDSAFRTYIGSRPYNYGGDAVLEIHNLVSFNGGIPSRAMKDPTHSTEYGVSNFNTTTVVNGNLIIRGRPYFTVGKNLHHFYDFDSNDTLKSSPDDSDGNVVKSYFYGYKASSDSFYEKCTDEPSKYNFNKESNKCINLKTNVSSDRRLKNIDGKFTAGMDRLRNINVYNFNFKDDKDKTPQVGVIAQELQKVFPTAVFKGEDGYLRIRWDEMFYAMINGIKEIDRRIIALVHRTTNVENQISQLEKQNTQLKTQVDNLTVRVNKLKAR